MKKYLLIAILVCAGAGTLFAQKTGDDYANLFNEHLNKGLHSGITMSVELPLYTYGEQVMTLEDTVNGGAAGYLYNGYTIVDSAELDSAFMWLDKGIKAFPNRLDLYLGLATAHLYCLDVDKMLDVLEQAMKQETKNKKKWLWTNNEKLSKEYDLLFDRIQEDISRFLEAEDLDNAEKLARMAMKYFPKNAVYVNDLGYVYIYRNELEEGLKYFKKALQMNPKDELIKGNVEYVEQLISDL